MSTWAEADALKAQLAKDEAKAAKEADAGPYSAACVMVGLSAYATHSRGCDVMNEAEQTRLAAQLARPLCTCGRDFEMKRAMEWVARHAPDVYRLVTGISPGDA